MRRFSFITRVLITVGLVLFSLLGMGATRAAAQVAAEPPDSYVSELSGLEVAGDGDFTISATELQEYEDGEGELVTIDSPTAYLQVAFFDDSDDPEQTIELFNDGFASEMDSFEILDEGFDGDRAWSFAQSELDNEEYLVYLDVMPDVVGNVDLMAMLAAPSSTFFEDLEAAQEDVTVDAEGVFADVDGMELEEALEGGGSPAGDDDSGSRDGERAEDDDTTETEDDAAEDDAPEDDDSASTEEDDDSSAATRDDEGSESAGSEGDNDRRSGARLPESDRSEETEELEDENQTETGNDGQTGSSGFEDFEDAGLVSETEYVSPQYDVPVEWGDQWFVDYGDEEAVISDSASGTDSLFLVWGGEDVAWLIIDMSAAEDFTPADFVDYWLSDDYLEENADPDAEVLLDDGGRTGGAVLMRDYLSEGDEVIILKEAVLLDDDETIAVVTLIAAPTMYDEIYGDAEGDVEISGEPALSVFSEDEIQESLEQ